MSARTMPLVELYTRSLVNPSAFRGYDGSDAVATGAPDAHLCQRVGMRRLPIAVRWTSLSPPRGGRLTGTEEG